MNNRVVVFKSDGTWVRNIGSEGSGDGQLNGPLGVDVSANGYIFVADAMNNRVVVFKSDGTWVRNIGSEGSGDGQLDTPFGVAFDSSSNYVYVADTNNNRVVVFKSDGSFIRNIGYGKGVGDGQLVNPVRVAINPFDKNIYVSNADDEFNRTNNYVVVFKSDGSWVRSIGSAGDGDGQLQSPYGGVAFDREGFIYVGDISSLRIVVFDPSGDFVRNIYSIEAEGHYPFFSYGISINPQGTKLFITIVFGGQIVEYNLPYSEPVQDPGGGSGGGSSSSVPSGSGSSADNTSGKSSGKSPSTPGKSSGKSSGRSSGLGVAPQSGASPSGSLSGVSSEAIKPVDKIESANPVVPKLPRRAYARSNDKAVTFGDLLSRYWLVVSVFVLFWIIVILAVLRYYDKTGGLMRLYRRALRIQDRSS